MINTFPVLAAPGLDTESTHLGPVKPWSNTLVILDEPQRRALTFVRVANSGGYQPTAGEVDEWVTQPTPIGAKHEPSPFQTRLIEGTLPAFINLLQASGFAGGKQIHPAETLINSLLRLRWLRVASKGPSQEDRLSLTDLGSALLRSEEVAQPEASDVLVLTANDKMAYVSLMGRIAELKSPILVDPYLAVDQLAELLSYTSASRFLIGKNRKPGQIAPMRMLVDAIASTRGVQLRQDKSGRLHDRYVLSADNGYMFGASMNGVGKRSTSVLVPLTDLAEAAVRDEIEDIWNDAEHLAPTPSTDLEPRGEDE